MNNIYYTGRNRRIQNQVRNSSIRMRFTKRAARSIDQTSNYSTRKTEPKVQGNNSVRKHLTSISRQSLVPHEAFYRPSQNSHKPQHSPIPYLRQNMSHRINQPPNTFKIKFNKVQQSNTRNSNQIQKIIVKSQVKDEIKKQNLITKEDRVGKNEINYYDIRQLQNYPYLVKNTQEQQQQQTTNPLYKVQPMKKIFVCQTCCQFISIKEIHNHQENCIKPRSYESYQQKWMHLYYLLKELALIQQNSEAQKLADLIKWYLTKERSEVNTDMILYSDQLTRILNYRQVIKLQNISSQDLFQLIEKLGDKLELQRQRHPPSQPFWKICS